MVKLLAAAFLAFAATVADAADLAIDGQTDAQVAIGSSFTITLTGSPGAPAIIVIDISPGPVPVFGQDLPVGLTPALIILFAGTIPSTGSVTTPFPVPWMTDLVGKTFYLAGAVMDPTAPFGVDIANGASVTVGPAVSAGATQGTMVGRQTVLDGSGALDEEGDLPPGASVWWTLLETPPGSSTVLEGRDTAFPVLTPDVPGDYRIEAAVALGATQATAETLVHAWGLTTMPGDGAFTASPLLWMQGAVSGSLPVTMTVNGTPVGVDAGGNWGPSIQTFPPDSDLFPLTFEISHTDGTYARSRQTVIWGLPGNLGTPWPDAVGSRLGQSGLDTIEALGEAEMADADIAGLLLGVPPTEIANDELFGFTFFSAYAKFTGLTFSSMTLDLVPTPSGLDGTIRINNVVATFDVWGEILEIDYSLTGDMGSHPTVLSATLNGSVSGDQLQISVQNPSVSLQGFSFDLDGFFGSVAELFIIEDWVKDAVEDAVKSAVVAQLEPTLEEILGTFVLEGNLWDTLEVDASIKAHITGVIHDGAGITLVMNGQADVMSAEPGSPVITQYRATPGVLPAFGSLTPGGQPFGAAIALGDDFLNMLLASATGAGLLDGDMTTLIPEDPGDPGAITLTTDAMALLFPGAGFEHFPPGTALDLRAHGTVAPVYTTTPSGMASAVLEMANLEAVFLVPTPTGSVPLLSLAMDGSVQVDLTSEPDGTLTANVDGFVLQVQTLQAFPGSDLAILDQGVLFLADLLLPQIADAFDGIPIPSLEAQGLGILPVEASLIGANAQYLGIFGNLVSSTPGP